MNIISHTHFIVEDTPPPDQTQIVGHLYGIAPVFKTFIPDYAPNAEEEEEVETKVVKPRGRRPRQKATEQAETK